MVDHSLTIATEIDHRQWMAGHEFVYGILYCDILATHKAQRHSERAFELAREIGSQYWTNQAAGALARAYLLQGDLVRCRDTLSSVLSPSTLMDSHAKRYCWLHRAELALAEGEPELALDIIARLLANIPGLTGNVIPYLWRLHAEALVVVGKVHEAESIIQVALETVPAGHPTSMSSCKKISDSEHMTIYRPHPADYASNRTIYLQKSPASRGCAGG